MLSKFEHLIECNSLCDKSHRILLAVSGGLDSMVMLDLFRKAEYKIGVAHCNFQLRGEESDLDEIFVRDICKQINISCSSKKFDTNNYAVKNGMSTQMAARELRYEWFYELMNKDRWDLVATAHHANDNLETTILNFSRGTGWTGLKGIPIQSDHTIRPLLSLSKAELMEYAQHHSVAWREDRSNTHSDYDRNFLRHQVIPKLVELNESLISTFIKTNRRIVGSGELFDLGLSVVRQKYVAEEKDKVVIAKIFANVFREPASILWELIKTYGFNYDQCENMIRVFDKPSGKKFIAGSNQLTVDRDNLIVSVIDELTDQTFVNSHDKEVVLSTFCMTIDHQSHASLPQSEHDVILDGGKFKYPLLWRKWQQGDYFFPLGMEHKKKLSDFFIDNRLSLVDKDRATVLISGDDIVWVVGHRIDNRYKLTRASTHRTRFTLKSHFG